MLKTYDYWLFYKKDDNDLYAYTDSKELSKLFKSQRNMKIFRYEKVDLTKDEVADLATKENDKILEESELKYSDNGTIGSIKLVVTKMEKYSVISESADLIACDVYKYAWVNPYIFKDEIVKSLKKLKYLSCNNLLTQGKEVYLDIFSEADELAIFLRYFGNTL